MKRAQRAPKLLLLLIKGPVVKSHYNREPICYKFDLILEVSLRSCVAVILSQVGPHKAERKRKQMNVLLAPVSPLR